jgi:enterochelin esterase-like enzyme/peptidoglycan/xylan/chitin deacetylase (PgdA/CDA1 family)
MVLRRWRTLVAAIAAVAWLATGAVGAYRYVHRYELYRGFPPPVTPRGIPRGTIRRVRFRSRALGRPTTYLVYLPPGYRRAAFEGRRFGVLYLLHAPPGRADGFFLAGDAAVDANVLIAHRRIPPLLLVVPEAHTSQYGNDTEWADAKAGRYMGLVMDVVRDVDHRFATLRDRQHRAIAGLSEGGYGAINVALHHLSAFSAAESWSGYFTQTPTASFTGATPAQLAANSPSAYVGTLAPEIRALGFRAWLYQGKTDFTAPRHILGFSRQLATAGAEVHYGFFHGGHDWGVWRAQMPRMLVAVGHWFDTSPRVEEGHLYQLGHPLPHALLHRILYNPRRHCLIRHPPRGYRFSRFCLAYRQRYFARKQALAARSSLTISAGPPRHRWVALTFDADMTHQMLALLRDGRQRTWYDRRIVDELVATRTPATIFLTGLWARTYPGVVRRLARSPLFELENHSYDHAAWESPCYGLPTVAGDVAKRREVLDTARIVRQLTGRAPQLFRFPGGCHDVADGRLVRALGERAVDWDVVSGDAYLRSAAAVERSVLDQVRDGSIVVMHLVGAPNAPATADALRALIPQLRARGFELVTVQRLLAECLSRPPRARCPAEASFTGGGGIVPTAGPAG